MIVRHVACAALVCLVATTSGCSKPCPGEGPHDVTTRTAVGAVEAGTDLELRATCSRGTKLIGGGYWTDHLGYPEFGEESSYPEQGGHLAIVTASFPSDDGNSWIGRFTRGDSSEPSPARLAGVYAYCASGDLDVGIVQERESTSAPGGALATARVPAGAVVTGGGFRMEYSAHPGEPPGTLNGYVHASAPLIEGGQVRGWEAQRIDSLYLQPTTISAYAVFATRGLVAGTPVVAAAQNTPWGWGPFTGSLECAPGEFTTGGGFRIQNTGLGSQWIAHDVVESRANGSLTTWDFHGYDGYQTDRWGDPTTAGIALSALCLVSPHPKLCVEIEVPRQSLVDAALEAADPATQSESLHFAAEAYLGGTELPGSRIEWSIDGAPLTNGSNVDASMPLPGPVSQDEGFFQIFTVRATVHDAGRTASDSVRVRVSRNPPVE